MRTEHTNLSIGNFSKPISLVFVLSLKAITSGAETIVIDNTNTCSWEYENYVFMAKRFDYSIRIIRMNFSESDITLFGKRNVHNVPVFKIKEMFERFEDDSSEEIVS